MSVLKWLFIQLIIPVVFISTACCQVIDRKYIQDWLKKSDTTFKTKDITLYVLNGVPFQRDDSTKLYEALKTQSKYLSIDYLKSDEFAWSERPGRYVILISDNYLARKKLKKYYLKIALSKYKQSDLQLTDAYVKQPALIIDDNEIPAAECYNQITKIRPKHIFAINVVLHPVPWEYYGQNAKNGLVQIWTYDKK